MVWLHPVRVAARRGVVPNTRPKPRGLRYFWFVSDPAFPLGVSETSSVLMVIGDLDEPDIPLLREAIWDRSQGYRADLIVDLSGVTYLPSAAVAVLAKACNEAASAGATLKLRAPTGSIAERVLTTCALPHVAD